MGAHCSRDEGAVLGKKSTEYNYCLLHAHHCHKTRRSQTPSRLYLAPQQNFRPHRSPRIRHFDGGPGPEQGGPRGPKKLGRRCWTSKGSRPSTLSAPFGNTTVPGLNVFDRGRTWTASKCRLRTASLPLTFFRPRLDDAHRRTGSGGLSAEDGTGPFSFRPNDGLFPLCPFPMAPL